MVALYQPGMKSNNTNRPVGFGMNRFSGITPAKQQPAKQRKLSDGQNLPDPSTYDWDMPMFRDINYSVGGGSDPLGDAKTAYVTGGSPQWGANAYDVHQRLQKLNEFASRYKDNKKILSPNQLAMQRYHDTIGLFPAGEATMNALQGGGYGMGGAPQLFNEIFNRYMEQEELKSVLGADWQKVKDGFWFSDDDINKLTTPRIQQAHQMQSQAKDAKPGFAKQWGPALLGLGLSFIPGMQGIAGTIGKTLLGAGASAGAANMVGNMVLQGLIGGGGAAMTGGDIGKGLLGGVVGAGVGGLAGNIPGLSSLPKMAQKAITSTLSSGASSLAKGGKLNPIDMLISGAFGGLGGVDASSMGIDSDIWKYIVDAGKTATRNFVNEDRIEDRMTDRSNMSKLRNMLREQSRQTNPLVANEAKTVVQREAQKRQFAEQQKRYKRASRQQRGSYLSRMANAEFRGRRKNNDSWLSPEMFSRG